MEKKVYTREINSPPKTIIKNGKPIFGDFTPPPAILDIRKLRQPFSIMPLPSFLTKWRIRTSLCFSFYTENYIGTVDILEAYWLGFIKINIRDYQNGKKLYFATPIFRRRFIPRQLNAFLCRISNKKRKIKINWDYEKNHYAFILQIQGADSIPDILIRFFSTKTPWVNVTSVVPAPIMRRCAATHNASPYLNGTVKFFSNNDENNKSRSNILSFVTLRRSYYKLRHRSHIITVFGISDNKSIRFNVYTSNQDAWDCNLYNENILFIDNEIVPLPPVTITYPNGINKQWVIQDTETMVDLTFFPETDISKKQSLFFLRTEYHTLFGRCEGNIKGKDGSIYSLKGFFGIAKKQYLRL